MVRRTLAEAHEAMEAWADAEHYVNHPAHAFALLRQVVSLTASVAQNADDDPALFAYQLRDMLPKVGGLLKECKWWSDAVITADADAIPTTGVKSCLIET